MINNKWHFFFLFLQNPWLGSWTKPDTGRNFSLIWLMTTLSKFSFLLLTPTLAPTPWQPHSCHKHRGVQEHNDKRRLWTVPQRGSRKRKLLEKWSMAAAAICNSIQHQLTTPGCHSGLWQKVCVVHQLFPAMNLSAGMGGESGNEVAMASGSGISLQADRLHLDLQRLCLTRAVWPGLILTSLDVICLAGED